MDAEGFGLPAPPPRVAMAHVAGAIGPVGDVRGLGGVGSGVAKLTGPARPALGLAALARDDFEDGVPIDSPIDGEGPLNTNPFLGREQLSHPYRHHHHRSDPGLGLFALDDADDLEVEDGRGPIKFHEQPPHMLRPKTHAASAGAAAAAHTAPTAAADTFIGSLLGRADAHAEVDIPPAQGKMPSVGGEAWDSFHGGMLFGGSILREDFKIKHSDQDNVFGT